MLLCPMAQAQSLIRDAEIERTLGQISQPIFRAAGLSPSQVKIYIVNSRDLNAFVAGGNNIFLNTGLLRRLESLDQLQAVIAHEVGHITGGHLARRNAKVRASSGAVGIGLLLAIAAAAAGGGEGAAGAALAVQSAVTRDFLRHTRAEEGAADQAGLRYMVGAGADPNAIMEVLQIFRGQEILSASRADPYVRTHPLWSARIRYLEDQIASAPKGREPSASDAYWHARMVAKFDAFIGNPSRVLRRAKGNQEFDLLARAVAYHRLPDVSKSMQSVDALLRARPNDPFYHELKGQFLLEGGKAAASVASYRKAVSLAPKEPLLLAGLGRALVAVGSADSVREALRVLEKSRQLDGANARVLRDLATAYARTGNNGQASLVTAERFALQTRFRDAAIHATRAAGQLPEGSPGWRRAQDILAVAKQAQ